MRVLSDLNVDGKTTCASATVLGPLAATKCTCALYPLRNQPELKTPKPELKTTKPRTA